MTAAGGAPLPGASVSIQALGIGAIADASGNYRFTVPGARVTAQPVAVIARLIGYQPQTSQVTLTAGGTATQNFTLAPNPLRLGEIVVTGAGTATSTQRLGTARTAIDTTAITRAVETNFVQALAGKAPGVVVTGQSGDPGSSSKIIIRGLNTIQGTGQPLFVVDGTPINNQTINTGDATASTVAPNRAADINPDDIESVEVLKSSAAAAIFGARAGQGVVLITTKKGRAGQTRYSLRSTLTRDEVNRVPDLQREFGQGSLNTAATCPRVNCVLTGSSFGPAVPAGTPTFDQARAMFENGSLLDNTLTASGGTERTQFFLSGGTSNQDGIIVGTNDNYRRNTVRLNASHRVLSGLQVSGNVSYIDARGSFIQRGSNLSGITLGGWRTAPTFDNRQYRDTVNGLHRGYRFPNPSPTSQLAGRVYDNPYFVINEQRNTADVGRAFGNVNLNYTPAEWLQVQYTLGSDYTSDERLEALPKTSSSFPAGLIRRANFVTYQVDNNLTATGSRQFTDIFEGRLTLGTNFNSERFRQNYVTGQNLIADEPYALTNTVTQFTDQSQGGDYRSLRRRESYFAQAQTSFFEDEVNLTGSLRNDGFSTFGASSRRNWFPSLQASWLFTRRLGAEAARGMLGDGKLRAAFGQTGTEPGVYLTTGYFTGGFVTTSYGDRLLAVQNGQGGLQTAFRLEQPDLKPERQSEFEGGFDLGFFRNAADVSFTYYNRDARDVIFDLPLAASSGFSQQARNAARIRNRGVEVALNVRPLVREKYDVSLGFQFARNRNRVLELQGAEAVNLPNGGYFTGTLVSAVQGEAVGVFRANDFVRCGRGLTTVEGYDIAAACQGAARGALFIGDDGFPLQDPTLRVVGDPNPDWNAAFRPALRYGGFQLSGLLDIRRGGDVWNGTKGALYNFGTHGDTRRRAACVEDANDDIVCSGNDVVFGQTYTPGRATPNPEPTVGPGAGKAVPVGETWYAGLGSGFGPVSSQFIEDGSFVKLREITFGYSLTQPFVRTRLGLTSIDVRLAGRNLGLWTDYTGVDPETNLGGAAVGAQGIDYFNNPQTRSYVLTFGLNR